MATKYGTAYPVAVDYGRSVEDAVKRCRFDGVNSDINSRNFPTEREERADIVVELVCLNQRITTKDALRELDERGYRPAELLELLAFLEKYPDAERHFPVAALGSGWQRRYGDRFAPFFYKEVSYVEGSKRILELQRIDVGWGAYCRFAAVRK